MYSANTMTNRMGKPLALQPINNTLYLLEGRRENLIHSSLQSLTSPCQVGGAKSSCHFLNASRSVYLIPLIHSHTQAHMHTYEAAPANSDLSD